MRRCILLFLNYFPDNGITINHLFDTNKWFVSIKQYSKKGFFGKTEKAWQQLKENKIKIYDKIDQMWNTEKQITWNLDKTLALYINKPDNYFARNVILR